MLLSMSSTPIVSRIECILSDEMPTSTVRMPVSAAMAGPIVDPHGQSWKNNQTAKKITPLAHMIARLELRDAGGLFFGQLFFWHTQLLAPSLDIMCSRCPRTEDSSNPHKTDPHSSCRGAGRRVFRAQVLVFVRV